MEFTSENVMKTAGGNISYFPITSVVLGYAIEYYVAWIFRILVAISGVLVPNSHT
jgi:hypothetical protein